MTGERAIVAASVIAIALATDHRAARAAPATSEDPHDIVGQPVVLDEGTLAAAVVTEVDMTTSEVTRPISIAPDLWFGVTSRLTLGVIHSDYSLDRFEPGASVCVITATRGELGCTHHYRGGGVDARWGILADRWPDRWKFAVRARLFTQELQPFEPALALGGVARWHRGRFAITTDPYIRIGLDNNDRGNRSGAVVPIELALQPTCRWALWLATGWNSDFAVIRDGWHIPMALGTTVRVPDGFELGAAIGFPTLLGPQDNAKSRTLFVMVGWRTPRVSTAAVAP